MVGSRFVVSHLVEILSLTMLIKIDGLPKQYVALLCVSVDMGTTHALIALPRSDVTGKSPILEGRLR